MAEQVLLAVGRGPGEVFGNGGGRGDGIAAETVHHPGQDRNGRLVAVHQDVLAFAHILQQLFRDGGQVEGEEFVGVKALPFGLPVDGQHFALLDLPQLVVGELLAQGVDFGAGSHVGFSLTRIYSYIFIANKSILGNEISIDSIELSFNKYKYIIEG